ncbi:MAG: POTRA domain-containing protein, partial [Microcoleus sp.]
MCDRFRQTLTQVTAIRKSYRTIMPLQLFRGCLKIAFVRALALGFSTATLTAPLAALGFVENQAVSSNTKIDTNSKYKTSEVAQPDRTPESETASESHLASGTADDRPLHDRLTVLPAADTPSLAQLPNPADSRQNIPVPIPILPTPSPLPEPQPPAPLPPPEQLLQPPTPAPPQPENLPDIPGTIAVDRFEVVGSTVFSKAELDAALKDFVGRPLTFAELLQARSAVNQLYLSKGYITSGALIPPQTLTGGVVKILVVEGRLEGIEVVGTKRLNPNYVKSRLALATTGPLNEQRLLEALQLLQLSGQLQNITAELQAGSRPG